MIDAAVNDALDALEACPCCLLGPQQRCLKTPYTHLNNTEIYSDMLKECFNIQLDVPSDDCGICEECVVRLRDASNFKRKVQRSQRELQERLARALKIIEEAPPTVVKSEIADEDGTNDNLSGEVVPDEMSGAGGEGEGAALCEEPHVKSELADDDGPSDNSLGEPETARDAASNEDPISHDQSPAELETPAAASDEDSVSLAWASTSAGTLSARSVSARALNQLEMTCSVRLERLRCDESLAMHLMEIYSSFEASAEEPYTCDTCGKQFTRKLSLIRHIREHTGTAYSCEVSSKRFSRKRIYSKNVRTHSVKSNKRLVDKRDVENHLGIGIHAVKSPHSCNVCSKRFAYKCALLMHVRIHTGQKPFSCDICNKQFTKKCNLQNHVLVHTGQKPYTCSICNKQFRESGHLKRHAGIHTGQRPHSCHICDKRFIQKSCLNRHFRTHTGQKPYKCTFCNKLFSDQSALVKHVRIHTGEKPYSCYNCNKQFSRKSHLRCHVRIHIRQEQAIRTK